MNAETLFTYMQQQVADGESIPSGAKRALDEFASTPVAAYTLLFDVLGAKAIAQWYGERVGFGPRTRMYAGVAEPEAAPAVQPVKRGARMPAREWQPTIQDPGNIPVFGRTINSMKASDVREVIERYSALAGTFRPAHGFFTGKGARLRACGSRGARLRPGVPARLVHDLRRSAARRLIHAGVPEQVAMPALGHKTRSIFARYNIVTSADLSAAHGKLMALHSGMGKVTAKSEPFFRDGRSVNRTVVDHSPRTSRPRP